MNGLVQERHNSSVLAMELYLSYTNPLMCFLFLEKLFIKNKANLRDFIAATGLVILLELDSNRQFFRPCDLEIWWMTRKNNKARLLYNIKLCVPFHIHQ